MGPPRASVRGDRRRIAGVAQAGAGPLSRTDTIRVLSTEFTVVSNKPELIERLATVVQRATHDVPLEDRCEIAVDWHDGEYRIEGGSEPAGTEFSLATALDVVCRRMHRRAMERYGSHTRIHAASGIGPGGMVLLVGEKRSGKSTLSVQLLLQGLEMLGDELVLLREGRAVTFPRRFYLRHAALDLLPALDGRLDGAVSIDADVDGKLVALDPTSLGHPWRIRPAPLAAVVSIEPNHGGASRLVPCTKTEMVRRVMTQCSPPLDTGREGQGWVADLCRTINQVETMTLHLGDLGTAAHALRRFLLPG